MKNFFVNVIDICGSAKSLIYLRILSFTESIFFPIPTDALLVPMVLSGQHNWIRITATASFWSVLGGIVGYYLGYYLFDLIEPYLYQFNKYDQYISAKSMFETYGIIFLFISAFTPIPYKVFTISAGVLNYNIFLFILISIIGRSARFFLVAFICKKYGEHIIRIVNKYLLIMAIFVFLLLFLWIKH
jgi:membrane protein YqaA with SNARE-associated domain